MNVLSLPTIKEAYEKHAIAKKNLLEWYHTTKAAMWDTMEDLRRDYPSAEMVVDNKVVFNIKGNEFRLVAIVLFRAKRVLILKIATHAEYSKIRIADL